MNSFNTIFFLFIFSVLGFIAAENYVIVRLLQNILENMK